MCIRDRDRLDALLTDPGLTVIFDEAELAAHRAGWDAARWVRHLSAKLRRDDNVLPPGGEPEQDDLQPSPGAMPVSYTHLDVYKRQVVYPAKKP